MLSLETCYEHFFFKIQKVYGVRRRCTELEATTYLYETGNIFLFKIFIVKKGIENALWVNCRREKSRASPL